MDTFAVHRRIDKKIWVHVDIMWDKCILIFSGVILKIMGAETVPFVRYLSTFRSERSYIWSFYGNS